ncbi:helix-turn-helix domain-containing protein [Paenibacillus cremeus]|uniref:Helix-turn-helix domain-containing protein n=1 Tax=Paenibacillus cremeus TaxID=2163881 RepID=A0A559KGP9_9BACL|nr:helix-turn-helix domain-containing protein [Paenibacillus cremeus]TVY11299.1 helix-turn-helix domain-containing protein [Paenibacillus cremeus]
MRNGFTWLTRILTSFFPRANYLKRLIWFGCLSVSIPVVLAGSTYYHFSMKELTQQITENNQASLVLLKDRMENVLFNIENDSLKIAVHPSIKENLGRSGFSTDFITQMSILDALTLHKNANSMISEIIFYDKKEQFVLSNDYGYSPIDRFGYKQDIEAAMSQKETVKWTYLPRSSGEGDISFVRLLNAGETQGVVIINVKEKTLRSTLVNYSTNSKNQALAVLDSSGRILLHSTDRKLLGLPAQSVPGLKEAALNSEPSADNERVEAADGQNLLMQFNRTTLGRTYVSLVPESDMQRQLLWIRWVIVFSIGVFLFVGILLNLIVTRRAYNPIEQLIRYGEHLQKGQITPQGNEIEYIKSCLSYLNEQATTLEGYLKRLQPGLRDQLLIKLLKSYVGRKTTICEECEQYGIPLQGRFVVLVAIVENIFKEKRFLPSEGAIVMFAVTNVMNELLAKSALQGYVVEHGEREGVAILHFPEGIETAQITAKVKAFAEEIRSALQTYMAFSVAVGIGGQREDVLHLSESYREAQRALQHRIFDEAQTVISFEELDQIGKQTLFTYPRDQERLIIEALARGELVLAEQELNVFSQNVKTSESYNMIFQCYHVLLTSIIQSLEEKGPGVIDQLGDNWFDQLKARQTSREIYEWFIEVIFPLYQQITDESRKMGARVVVHKVCRHIKEHGGANHSLVECSEMVGMSPSYFSRLFKKEVGLSFVEYVMEYKVEHAKQLLRDTDLNVMEIAEKVGYSERNLNRAFQRYVSMTPKQYRVSLR